jgi:hypothetical protein
MVLPFLVLAAVTGAVLAVMLREIGRPGPDALSALLDQARAWPGGDDLSAVPAVSTGSVAVR